MDNLEHNWHEYWRNHKDPLVRQRYETAYNFYRKAGYNHSDTRQEIRGINFNREVEVVKLPKDDFYTQWQTEKKYEQDIKGSYFTQSSSQSELGIQGEYKGNKRIAGAYRTTREVYALKSTASDIQQWHSEGRKGGELFYGGGTQYFVATQDREAFQPLFRRSSKSSKSTESPSPTTSKTSKQGNLRITAKRSAQAGKSERGIYNDLKRYHPELAQQNPEAMRRLAKNAYHSYQKQQKGKEQPSQAPPKTQSPDRGRGR